MKKIIWVFLASFAFLFLFSTAAQASLCLVNHPETNGGLVPCGQFPDCRCEIKDFFIMLRWIFDFIVKVIAAPLAGLLIVVGGVLILLSGINANWYATGKRLITWAIISFLLILGSWLIVDIVLKAIGYTGSWSSIF
ncbi:MAG: hypothetical protein Q7S10_02685 [bacterium]|nr:hypothetical protein [bacterium]